ncbi:unnamed protein product [Adineta steineri]|uniref:Ephrin RBD domain-containing protein n=1 Tax=Adineta steineri TaxID=433720 RepID=A0A814CH72_9BILA|nr:unnamed protein product [Adineta steineri]CAF0788585.1 unnamed protein product [Adineta steineri]CAF0942449.1 unnamed protein product [Adineta steineri]CAF1233381.1 unnamed protein product [Adineta steineri]CAF1523831.1 unnamed protein product [Adineta steineri]
MFINELLVVSVLLLIFITRYQTYSLLLQPFYWNQTTFRSYQDGSLVLEVRLGDVMDLICPFYDEQQSYMTSEQEQYDIYRVSENEYNQCNINQFNSEPTARRVITCNSPYDVMKYTLNFRSYLPIPNGFEFRPNQTYYFLSTSLSHQQCNKLKIFVHDYQRMSLSTSTKSYIDNQEHKPFSFPHYSHHRHESSQPSIYKTDHRPFLHAIKAQRHSDATSIKWITDGPHPQDNDKSQETKYIMERSSSPSNMLSLALSSSSTKLTIPFILICLLLSLR